MGDLLQIDTGAWVAVVGGKPKPDWSGLYDKTTHVWSPIGVGEMRLRPMLASASAKLYSYRTKGQDPVFTIDSNFDEFVQKVQGHLEATGMDTIAYVRDPDDPSRMLSCVTDHHRFRPTVMTDLLKGRFDKYDSYDKKNDDDAVRYLLKSVDEALQTQLKSVGGGQPFARYFTELVSIVRQTAGPSQDEGARQETSERAKELRDMVVSIKPSSSAGDSVVDEMWNNVKPLVDVMIAFDWFDHSITRELAFNVLAAGGIGPRAEYCKQICTFIIDHRDGVQAASVLQGKEKEEYMARHKLMPKDLFEVASRACQEYCHEPLQVAPPQLPAMGLFAPPSSDAQPGAEAYSNSLLQAMSPYFKPTEESAACYSCGSPDHFKRNCPTLKAKSGSCNKSVTNRRGKVGVREVTKKQGCVNKVDLKSPASWKLTAPDPSEPQKKMVKNRTFFWCGSCNRWSTSHCTASHVRSDATLCPGAPASVGRAEQGCSAISVGAHAGAADGERDWTTVAKTRRTPKKDPRDRPPQY
jgi:Zinc knuckle